MKRWAAAIAVITLGWLATPSAVPIYDGVGVPDEPYRYVGKTPGPSTATASAAYRNGKSDGLEVKTSENGPQAFVDIGEGAFRLPTGTMFTVTLTPVPRDGTQPPGDIDGNEYRMSANNQATVDPQTAQGFVFLRAAVASNPSPFMAYRPGPSSPWKRLKTSKAGTDTYVAPFRALGDFAMVQPAGSKTVSAAGLSTTRIAVLAAGVIALIGITVLLLRRPHNDDA